MWFNVSGSFICCLYFSIVLIVWFVVIVTMLWYPYCITKGSSKLFGIKLYLKSWFSMTVLYNSEILKTLKNKKSIFANLDSLNWYVDKMWLIDWLIDWLMQPNHNHCFDDVTDIFICYFSLKQFKLNDYDYSCKKKMKKSKKKQKRVPLFDFVFFFSNQICSNFLLYLFLKKIK